MPSPFPGMDPYLECGRWTGFHSSFVSEIQREISLTLPSGYVVLPEERLVIELVDVEGEPIHRGEVFPDVSVLAKRPRRKSRGSVATLEPPLQIETVTSSHHTETFIEIRDVVRQRLVTAIEVLSPTNKTSHRSEYLAKRDLLLASDVNLVEMDLLIGGRRLPMKTALPDSHYFVFVSRATARPMTDIWPISLKSPLPTIPIPLRSDDADIVIDLQQIYRTVYERNRYAKILDYGQPLDVVLGKSDAEWIRKQTRLVKS